jgi:hypothetical protein
MSKFVEPCQILLNLAQGARVSTRHEVTVQRKAGGKKYKSAKTEANAT